MNKYEETKKKFGINTHYTGVVYDIKKGGELEPVIGYQGISSMLNGAFALGFRFTKKRQVAYLADPDMNVVRIYHSNGRGQLATIEEIPLEDDLCLERA